MLLLERARAGVDPRLLKNVSYLGIANAVYAAARWLMIIVVTKIGGVTATSQLSLGLAVAVPVMTFAGAGLRVIVTSDVKKNYSYGEYFAARLLLNLLGLAAVAAFASWSHFSTDAFQVILLIGIVKFIEGLQEICWGVSQRHEQMKTVGISRIAREAGMVLALGLGLVLAQNLKLAISLWIFWWAIIFVFYDLPNTSKIEKLNLRLTWKTFRGIFLLAAPLALVWGTLALNEKVGQYLLAGTNGEEAVGYYAPLTYILQAGGLAVSATGEAMIPRLAGWFKRDRRKYFTGGLRLAGFGFFVGAVLFAGCLLLGKPLLGILYRPEYVQYHGVLLLLTFIGMFRFIFDGLGRALTAAGVFWLQVPMTLSSLLVTTLAGLALIPRYGLSGAAMSSGLGLVVSLSFMLVVFLKVGLASSPAVEGNYV